MQDYLLWAVLILLVIVCALLVVLIVRQGQSSVKLELEESQDQLMQGMNETLHEVRASLSEQTLNTERSLRQDIHQVNGAMREDQNRHLQNMQMLTKTVDDKLLTLTQAVSQELQVLQDKTNEGMRLIDASNRQSNEALSTKLFQALSQIHVAVNTSLENIRKDNDVKLEQMRSTVQEKLENTLTDRLNTSFKIVDEKLGLVQTGLGEMRSMAQSVRDLKLVLTNQKTRGNYGETQLASILSDLLAPNQYLTQAKIYNNNVIVDFAIRMPGRDANGVCWLPIDSKFPIEDYQRLMTHMEAGDDKALIAQSRKNLASAILKQAASISEKYIQSPLTTEFAIMFLCSEGLYAEVIRTPGLFETLQNKYRVTPAGPTVISALINSLQMGFVTLSLQERSAEVWKVLSEVKTEFDKFATALDKVENDFTKAQKSLSAMTTRQRVMRKKINALDGLESGNFEISNDTTSSDSTEATSDQSLLFSQADEVAYKEH